MLGGNTYGSSFGNFTSTGSSTANIIVNTTSTAITAPVNGTIIAAFDDYCKLEENRWWTKRHSLKDFDGELKLLSGAGKIILPDGSKIEIDDFDNFLLIDNKRKTKFFRRNHQLRPGQCFLMPDGVRIRMGYDDDYEIEDEDARVLYKGCSKREFNKYVNASELLGDFVGDLGKIGVIQSKVLKTPIEHFINWLIHRAAEQDDDQYAAEGVPTLIESKPVLLTHNASKPKCKQCGRFISQKRADLGINFCNSEHMAKYEMKMGI